MTKYLQQSFDAEAARVPEVAEAEVVAEVAEAEVEAEVVVVVAVVRLYQIRFNTSMAVLLIR
jgi:hypothetical protein